MYSPTRALESEIVASIWQSNSQLYRLADEPRTTILVACSKCDWKAAYGRNDLIASHGAEYPMPSLLNELAKPGCARLGNQWDHCGVYYVEPIGTVEQTTRG